MAGWVKSSFSSGSGECLEVRPVAPAVALRDSKSPSTGLVTVPARSWALFLTMITNQ